MTASRAQTEPLAGLGRNLTFGLFDQLGRAIVAGHYDRMPFPTELDLMRQYRVSHGVIREAVKMLAAKGLVSAYARRGIVAEPQTGWNLIDADILGWLLDQGFTRDLEMRFNDLRAAIEPEAAALAAGAARADDHARIEDALKRLSAARRGADSGTEADIAFRLAILGATRNPFYAQFRNLLAAALRASSHFPARIENPDAYTSVLEAVRTGDADRARRAMRRLVRGALG
jgi:DNA-binding FadR family transcriptional regulator